MTAIRYVSLEDTKVTSSWKAFSTHLEAALDSDSRDMYSAFKDNHKLTGGAPIDLFCVSAKLASDGVGCTVQVCNRDKLDAPVTNKTRLWQHWSHAREYQVTAQGVH